MHNKLVVSAILVAVFLGVTGQLFIKKGLNLLGGLDFSTGLVSTYSRILLSHWVILGISTYISSLFLWLYALSKVDLSFAYPFLAVSYVFVILFSWAFLGETIPILRLIGVLIICFGVFLIAKS
ncbi:MAG: EamA family transporter [Nitrospirota bacterium]